MKTAQILHNPTAGNGRHSKESLVAHMKKAGYKVKYTSTDDKDWENFYKYPSDVTFVAGGDGTVRKIAMVLLKNKIQKEQTPIFLLPLGTANNIAETLKIPRDPKFPSVEGVNNFIAFDCGKVSGVENEKFFIESIGIGVFPKLISQMKNNKIEDESPSDKLQRTLECLQKIIKKFKPHKAKIEADRKTLKGSFLMVELMNINFLGPNLNLAPNANPSDNYFDLIVISEENRVDLEDYVSKMIKGENLPDLNFVKRIRTKKLKVEWSGSHLHVDDILFEDFNGNSFTAEIIPGALNFIRN